MPSCFFSKGTNTLGFAPDVRAFAKLYFRVASVVFIMFNLRVPIFEIVSLIENIFKKMKNVSDFVGGIGVQISNYCWTPYEFFLDFK